MSLEILKIILANYRAFDYNIHDIQIITYKQYILYDMSLCHNKMYCLSLGPNLYTLI